MKAGPHLEEWDGLTDRFLEAPPGSYEMRLAINRGRHENVAAIGNTGLPPNADGHVPAKDSQIQIQRVRVDRQGPAPK
jgi:hypothetical protein